ncbi:MAG: hypothetical protein Q9166_001567 [cf. Caloplaca sp. 2 TL-2023]
MTLALRRSVDLDGNSGVAQLVVAIIFGTLATISVVLRIVSRRLSRVSLSMNDYMIIIALLPLSVCQEGITLDLTLTIQGVVAGGAGLSKHQLSSHEIRVFWKSMFAIIITWPIAQSMTKISILLFYIHLFPTKTFCHAAYTLIVVVSAWMIQQVLASLLLCHPISYNWDPSVNGSCGDVAANCLAGAGINTLTDILILVLPMPIIWRLHVPLRNKIILSFIFGLGSLICIISIVRLKSLFLYTTAPMMTLFDSDGPLNNNLPILYTVLESCLGVICACLIIMKPIFTHSKLFNSLGHKLSSWTSSSSNNNSNEAIFNGRGRKGSSAARAKKASWELAQQKSRFQDMQILKTCEIDVDLEAAIAESEEHLDWGDEKKAGATMLDARPVSGSTVSPMSSPKSKRSDEEIQKVESF